MRRPNSSCSVDRPTVSSSTLRDEPSLRTQTGQLIYRSVSTGAAIGAIEISDILAEARQNNSDMDITGVLTVVDNTFIQILEGPDAALDRLLAVLHADRRHTGLRTLQRRHVEQRSFADWAMVSPRLSPACVGSLGRLLASDEDRIDSYLPILKSALEAQDRLAARWQSPDRNGEQA